MGDMYKVFTIKGDDDTLTFFEEVTFAIHEMHDGWQDEIPTKLLNLTELPHHDFVNTLVLEPGRFKPYGGGTYGPPGTFMKGCFVTSAGKELDALHHNVNLFYTLVDEGYLKTEFTLSLFHDYDY